MMSIGCLLHMILANSGEMHELKQRRRGTARSAAARRSSITRDMVMTSITRDIVMSLITRIVARATRKVARRS